MRTVVAVCTLALLALWVSQPLAQKADTRAIKAAVAGYVGKKADADSKRVSLEVLSTAPHVEICKALKGSLRKDAERDAALELALKLNLRGFFADAEKQIAKSASAVAALGLISNDKGAIKALVDHWVKAEADS